MTFWCAALCRSLPHSFGCPAWRGACWPRRERARVSDVRAAIVVAALCWAGLILTHNLTALMAAGATVVVVLAVLIAQRVQGKRTAAGPALLRLAWAFALGLLLSAWYSVPALLEASNVAIGQMRDSGYTNHFAEWGSLFAWAFPYPYPGAANATVPLPAWLVLPALAAILLLLQRRKGVKGAAATAMTVVATVSLLLVTLWLMTASSAWVWRVFAPLLSRLQFPWRWQAIMAAAVAVALALILHALLKGQGRTAVRVIALVAAAFVTAYTVTAAPWAGDANLPDLSRAAMWEFDAAQGQVGATWTGEFLPRWVTEQRWAIGRAPSDPAESLSETQQGDPSEASVTLLDDGYLHAQYAICGAVELRPAL